MDTPFQENDEPLYRIWTIQLSNWRIAKARNIKILDITARSGIKPFAPHFKDVMAYKEGKLSEEEYTKIYLEKMQQSRQEYPKHWGRLKAYQEIALACYCSVGAFCHRHLFADEMEEYLTLAGCKVLRCGELLPIKEETK